MGEIIAVTEIPREKGYLYYCGKDKHGNLTLCKAKMNRGGVRKNRKSES